MQQLSSYRQLLTIRHSSLRCRISRIRQLLEQLDIMKCRAEETAATKWMFHRSSRKTEIRIRRARQVCRLMKITEAVISGNAVNAEASEYIRRIYSCDMIAKAASPHIFT